MKKINTLLFLCFALTALAQPGSLDPDFGNGGKLHFNLATSSELLYDVAVLPDGKLLALGLSFRGYLSGDAVCLVRYGEDGGPDPSFGEAGVLELENFGEANSMVIQPDGKIVVLGHVDFGAGAARVLRLLPDGNPDPDFGLDGLVDLAFPVNDAVELLPDGRMAVAGGGSTWHFAILLPDGSLDGAFGTGGVADFEIGASGLNDLAVQPDGKLLATGEGSGGKVALARLHPDGTLDGGFGSGGTVNSQQGTGQAVAVQPDGKIVVGGFRNALDSTQLKVFRYLPDGSDDPEFQPQPFVTTGGFQGAGFLQNDLLLLPDGKIMLSGFFHSDGQSDMALLRYLPDGSLDPSFGNGGLALADLSPSIERGTTLALLPNGNVLLGGHSNYDFALQAFDTVGNAAPGFNGGRLNLGEADDYGTHGVVQPDGRILIGGRNTAHQGGSFLLARLQPDGSIDESFSEDGQVSQGDETAQRELNDLLLQPDGKILVCGNSQLKIQVSRFHSDGSKDTTFGENGISVIEFADVGSGYSFAEVMALQPDGKIVVGGYLSSFPYQFALCRLLPDGSIDETFGVDGTVLTELSDEEAQIKALVIEPDGKIIAGGYSGYIGLEQFALACYLPDGSLDASFGNGGTLTLLDGTRCIINRLALQPDGKIVALGSGRDDNNQLTAKLLRLLPDGTPDSDFGEAGWVDSYFGGIDKSYGRDLILQPDGKILICGEASSVNFSLFALARYLPDGTTDASFGNEGFVLEDILPQISSAQAMAMHDGKVTLLGVTALAEDDEITPTDLAIARYLLDLDVGTLDFWPAANEVLVYPNPIAEEAILKFETSLETELSILLYDQQGRVVQVFSEGKKFQAGQYNEPLNFNRKLPAGTYFLQISNGAQSLIVQVFKK